jgi:hypothetical protein
VNPKGSPGIYDTTVDNYSSTAYPSPPWSSTPIGTPGGSGCEFEKCALKAFAAQDANPGLVPPYNGLGPNSNTYVNELIKQCGGKTNFPKKAKGYDYFD